MKEQRKNNILKIGLIIFVILVAIDQISKIIAISSNVNMTIIDNILNFKLIFNKGIAFGIGQGQNIGTFVVTNLIVLGIIIRFIWLQKERIDTLTMCSLFIILAGGVGNFIDRIFRGQVVDFIEVFPKIHFPIFNIADICIVVGWIMIAYTFARYTYKEVLVKKDERNNNNIGGSN